MKLVRLAALGVLLAQSGLPLAFAQGVAWAKMVRAGQSVSQAIEGRKPCGLCLKIRTAKSPSAITVAPTQLDWHVQSARSSSMVWRAVPLRTVHFPLISFSASPADPPPPRLG